MDETEFGENEAGIDASEVRIDASVVGDRKNDGDDDGIFVDVMKRLVECDEERDRTVFYTKGQSKEPFDNWLNLHLPSMIDRQVRIKRKTSSPLHWLTTREREGVEWIYVDRPLINDRYHEEEIDDEGLLFSWQKYIRSGRPITFQSIVELAGNYNVTSGKWMFFAETGAKIDILWQKIATGILGDSKSCLHDAKVSTYHKDQWRHVVCIYNWDFRNKDQVLQLERAIRDVGIKCQLKYKPDVYTYIGVYKKNPWGFKPTIFESMFDIKTGKSIITSDVFEV